jgi:SNF2 family DNA or RNA helicase
MANGQGRNLSWDELREYDVVLTTYRKLGAEYSRLQKYQEAIRNREVDQARMRKIFPLLGPKSLFYRVILDEAQYIKNKSTIAARAAYSLKSSYR